MYFNLIDNKKAIFRHPKIAWDFYVINGYKVLCSKLKKEAPMLRHAKKHGKMGKFAYISNGEFNARMKEMLESKAPFFVCRYGNSEFFTCSIRKLMENNLKHNISDTLLRKAKTGPGVFPETREMYLQFAQVYEKAVSQADMNAYWGTALMEEYMLKKILKPGCALFSMRALEPFAFEHPWTGALKGKKVLIVHPFADQIREQYEHRKELFANPEILPDFELITVPAIQANGDTVPEGIADWNEALEILHSRCREKDYDVALLSCGSFAVPLGALLKADGKQAIVVGGVLQIFFGIKGARWEQSRPDIVALYNDYWTRPNEKYKVKNAEKMVDGAAYW